MEPWRGRCATTGRLDEQALEYVRSPHEYDVEARRLLLLSPSDGSQLLHGMHDCHAHEPCARGMRTPLARLCGPVPGEGADGQCRIDMGVEMPCRQCAREGHARLSRRQGGEDGSATYPKIDMIMRVAELEESIVRKVLKLLQECGFICRGDQRYGISTCSKNPATFDWYEDTHRARRPTTPP